MPSLNVITCPELLQHYATLQPGSSLEDLHRHVSHMTNRPQSITQSVTTVTAVDSIISTLDALAISPIRNSYQSTLDTHRRKSTSMHSYTTDTSISPPHTGFFEHIFKRSTWSSNDTSLTPVIEGEISQVSSPDKPSSSNIYRAPTNKTVAALSSLPHAYFGWSTKQSQPQFFSLKPQWKPKFLVQSNATLHIFSTDQLDAMYTDSIILGKRASCVVVDGDSLRVTGEVLIGDDVLMVKTHVKRSILLQFNDEIDLGIWHDVLLTAIEEAKQGRRPLSYRKESPSTSPKSLESMDEERDKQRHCDIYGFLDDINEREKEIKKHNENIFLSKSRKGRS